jgi:glutamate carboxypeptidase
MLPVTDEARALVGYLEPTLPTYIEELRQLCAIECPTESKAGVDEAGTWVREWAGGRGWQLRTWADPETGDSVVVTLPGGTANGLMLMLVAHLDTVYPVGIAAERPLRRESDRILAPGCADNKSGLLSGLYALAALHDLDLLGPFAAVSLVCGADEERNMRSSLELLREMAPAYDAALVLEAGRENGDIVSARKGSGHFTLDVRGHQAHAGVEPYKGANAILALAQQIVALQLLNGLRPGATLNVGVVAGGTVSNVVPDDARAEIDVRVVLPEDREAMDDALRRIAATPYVAGTTSTLTGGWRAVPMARTPAIANLVEITGGCAAELGFEVNDAATGGISYANYLAGFGLPVLDGLGPVGGLDHSPDEYILVSSIVPRTVLLALLMLRRAQQ